MLPERIQKPNEKDPPRDSYTGNPEAELAFRRGFHHAVQFILTHIESLPDTDGLPEVETDVFVWHDDVVRWRDAALAGDTTPEGTPMPGVWS